MIACRKRKDGCAARSTTSCRLRARRNAVRIESSGASISAARRLGVEVAADDRGREQRLLLGWRQRAQAFDDARRDRTGNSAGLGARAVEGAAQQLFGDERAAFGELDDARELRRFERPSIRRRRSRATSRSRRRRAARA